MNTIVLGASGFIGSQVIRHLTESGHRVRALQHHKTISAEGVEILHGRLESFNWNILQQDLPDVIYHVARISGRSLPGRYYAGYKGYFANRRLMNWLGSLRRPPTLIYASGSLAYGNHHEQPVFEEERISPAGFQRFYIKAEYPLLRILSQEKIRMYVLRLPWVYGADSWFRQFFWEPMVRHAQVPVYGTGQNLMSLIHVQDCVQLMALMAQSGLSSRIIHPVTSPAITQLEFCKIMGQLTGLSTIKIPARSLRIRYGRTVHESLTFSLDLRNREPLIRNYPARFGDIKNGLASTMAELAANSPLQP